MNQATEVTATMHEMSIAQSLTDILQEEMVKNHASGLKSVKLNIGKLSAIVPEALSFCFEIIVSGTNMEGAVLDMEMIPLKGICLDCDQGFEIEDYVFSCPYCESPNIRTISGQDLSIVEMEVE
jgi:hydrogenase nickel incorporation protein HypA/HybF